MRFMRKMVLCFITVMIVGGIIGNSCWGDQQASVPTSKTDELVVARAQICEEMYNLQPINQTAIFSVAKDKAFCFAEIDGIVTSTHIYHNWIRRDNHVAGIKLIVKPPHWSTVSSISLRETDKGPWRVEITDMDGNILKTLRFSVVD